MPADKMRAWLKLVLGVGVAVGVMVEVTVGVPVWVGTGVRVGIGVSVARGVALGCACGVGEGVRDAQALRNIAMRRIEKKRLVRFTIICSPRD